MQTLKEKKIAIENKTILVTVKIQQYTEYWSECKRFRFDDVKTGFPDHITRNFPNNRKGNKECFDFMEKNKVDFDKLPERIKVVSENTIQGLKADKKSNTKPFRDKINALESLLKTLPEDLCILKQLVTIKTI